MSLNLVPACSYCHSYEKIHQCKKCYTISYCSPLCQKLDWDSHKKFCLKNESESQAMERRNHCLALIHGNNNVVLKCLIKGKFFELSQCLLVQENEVMWQYPSDLRKYESQGRIRDKTRLDELEHEMAPSMKNPSLYVFYQDSIVSRVYLFSSIKFNHLYKAVSKIPMEMILNILRIRSELDSNVSRVDDDGSSEYDSGKKPPQ